MRGYGPHCYRCPPERAAPCRAGPVERGQVERGQVERGQVEHHPEHRVQARLAGGREARSAGLRSAGPGGPGLQCAIEVHGEAERQVVVPHEVHLGPQVQQQADHRGVVQRHLSGEPPDAGQPGPVGQPGEQLRRESTALPAVDHRDCAFRRQRVLGGPDVARHSQPEPVHAAHSPHSLGLPTRELHGAERLVVVVVEVGEAVQLARGQHLLRSQEAQPARACAEPGETVRQERRVGRRDRADQDGGPVAQHDIGPAVGPRGSRGPLGRAGGAHLVSEPAPGRIMQPGLVFPGCRGSQDLVGHHRCSPISACGLWWLFALVVRCHSLCGPDV